MKKQALVIGLGQFGLSLSNSLSRSGIEVLAIDINPVRVELADPYVAESAAFDATDEDALAKATPDSRDVCVCAIGPESKENAILVTALLRQMGAKYIISRASDELTERILSVVGAHEVVNPERDYGERLAKKLAHTGLLEQIPLGENLAISELFPPTRMHGRTLRELALPKRFEISVVGIRKNTENGAKLTMPASETAISSGDILVVVSAPESVLKMLERMK
jgi:trk system potassium uptake protein